MTEKEKTLIARCLQSEKAAWDALVVQYSNLVYHAIKTTFSLYHAEPDTEQIEDLYQEFFVSILRDDFKKLRQFRGDRSCSLASWLRVVASRLTIDFLRKQRATHVEANETLVPDQPNAPGSLIDQEEQRSLAQALVTLSPRDRLIIDLSYRHALSPQDIAEILKISVPAIYTQKSRILAKLRELLSKTAAL